MPASISDDRSSNVSSALTAFAYDRNTRRTLTANIQHEIQAIAKYNGEVEADEMGVIGGR